MMQTGLLAALTLLSATCFAAMQARAADLTEAPAPNGLPTFAQAPSQPSSPWAGLYVGSELSVVGGKGVKGGVGGDSYLGYNHEFANGVIVGVQGSAGYAPSLYRYSNVRGYDFAGANVKVGYDMGRLVPYVTAGMGFARPDSFSSGRFHNGTDSLNDLFASGGHPATITTVGAGFDYAITNNLSMGVSVSATQLNRSTGFGLLPPP